MEKELLFAAGVMFEHNEEKKTPYCQASVAVGWFHTTRRGPQSGQFVTPPVMPSDLGYTDNREKIKITD